MNKKIYLVTITFLIILFNSNGLTAQMGKWFKVDVDPQSNPSPRCQHEMAYDSDREIVVLHGGFPITNDTWEWNVNTNTWANVSNEGPMANVFGMAYDAFRKVTVISGVNSGGYTGTDYNSETWEWDGRHWEKVNEEKYTLLNPAMAYHPERKTVIRQGGIIDTKGNVRKTTSMTCEWDGNRWNPLPDGPSLGDHEMVYDSIRNKMVLFGGIWKSNSISNETWEFDGVTWAKVADTGPKGREQFSMVFDSNRRVTVLFGGGLSWYMGFNQTNFEDMWQWDGMEWTPIPVESPTEHVLWTNMSYIPKYNEIVMFGGSKAHGSYTNDTWIFSFQSGIPSSMWSKYER